MSSKVGGVEDGEVLGDGDGAGLGSKVGASVVGLSTQQ